MKTVASLPCQQNSLRCITEPQDSFTAEVFPTFCHVRNKVLQPHLILRFITLTDSTKIKTEVPNCQQKPSFIHPSIHSFISLVIGAYSVRPVSSLLTVNRRLFCRAHRINTVGNHYSLGLYQAWKRLFKAAEHKQLLFISSPSASSSPLFEYYTHTHTQTHTRFMSCLPSPFSPSSILISIRHSRPGCSAGLSQHCEIILTVITELRDDLSFPL